MRRPASHTLRADSFSGLVGEYPTAADWRSIGTGVGALIGILGAPILVIALLGMGAAPGIIVGLGGRRPGRHATGTSEEGHGNA